MRETPKISSQSAPDSCVLLADRLGLNAAAAKGLNFVFSPLSLRAALSLAAVGSNGATLEEFLSFLGSDTIGDVNSAAEALMAAVRPMAAAAPNPNPNPSLGYYYEEPTPSHVSLVNSVWVEKTVALKPLFKETAVSVYNAEVGKVDFMNKAQKEGERINAWIESKTNGLIKDLIPIDDLNESTTLILVNALYFKGPWRSMFSYTRDGDFHLLDGTTTVQAPFMSNGYGQYIALFDGFRVLRLHYKKDRDRREFSMLIFLPDRVDGLNELVKNAVSDRGFFERHSPTKIVATGRFAIPRFKISCGFDPSGVLQEMGLKAAFNKEEGQFEEMAYPRDELFRLYISAVRHKATIEVDEKGTEAAAATEVEVCYFGGCMMDFEEPPPTVDFVADHPFMFVIMEESGAVLFLGHVVNPLEEEAIIQAL